MPRCIPKIPFESICVRVYGVDSSLILCALLTIESRPRKLLFGVFFEVLFVWVNTSCVYLCGTMNKTWLIKFLCKLYLFISLFFFVHSCNLIDNILSPLVTFILETNYEHLNPS